MSGPDAPRRRNHLGDLEGKKNLCLTENQKAHRSQSTRNTTANANTMKTQKNSSSLCTHIAIPSLRYGPHGCITQYVTSWLHHAVCHLTQNSGGRCETKGRQG